MAKGHDKKVEFQKSQMYYTTTVVKKHHYNTTTFLNQSIDYQ